MKKKAFMYFEWVVMDNCNMFCVYCVNKGEYSQKHKNNVIYIPGKEVQIANKIIEISKHVDRVTVNMTGGEPLMADNIRDAISILSSAKNLNLTLVTNLQFIEKIIDVIQSISYVIVSLHVQNRNNDEFNHLIKMINTIKKLTKVVLMQVDYNLTSEDRSKLAQITAQTGLGIRFQIYVPPWSEKYRPYNYQEIISKNYVKSLGKRCSLGNIYYFINADGTFFYGLWCEEPTRKIGNFTDSLDVNLDILFNTEISKCVYKYCPCNYNLNNYMEYYSACKKYGYSKEEIFDRINYNYTNILKAVYLYFRNRLMSVTVKRHL